MSLTVKEQDQLQAILALTVRTLPNAGPILKRLVDQLLADVNIVHPPCDRCRAWKEFLERNGLVDSPKATEGKIETKAE